MLSSTLLMGSRRLLAGKQQHGNVLSAAALLRGFSGSAAGGPPPSTPPKSPYNIDPNSIDKTPEEARVHYRTYEESEFKLGKHRSNALELVEKYPVVWVDGERAICDGGGGALGHPLEYISLQRPNEVQRCKYCGLRFGSNSWH